MSRSLVLGRAVAATVLAVLAALIAGAPPAAGAPLAAVAYDPPVEAPITDPFRPPPRPWLPGNRGVEYATPPGTEVGVAADGHVTFAGPVASQLHVTVRHADGIRTSYSFLARVSVGVGQRLRRGAVVGISGARLHVGARRGDTYIDPESLWGRRGPPRPQLVPLDGWATPLRGVIRGRAVELPRSTR